MDNRIKKRKEKKVAEQTAAKDEQRYLRVVGSRSHAANASRVKKRDVCAREIEGSDQLVNNALCLVGYHYGKLVACFFPLIK